MKSKKQSNQEYYARRNIEPSYCANCFIRLRSDCTRAVCKKCYRFSDEYKQIRKNKSRLQKTITGN